MPAFYAIALLIAFYALVAAEILIPSGGILGLTAAVVAVTSIIIGSTYSISMGLTLLLIYLITTPILFAIMVRLWPRTRIGRQMLNRDTLQSDTTLPPPTTLDGTPLDDFVGRIGVATSNLLPSGQVKVDGHKTDAVSTGLPIDAGTKVMVVRVNAGKLQVREANPEEVQRERPADVDNSQAENMLGEDAGLVTMPPIEEVAIETATGASSLDDVDFEALDIEAPAAEESEGRVEPK